MKWKLFFKTEQEVIDNIDSIDIFGYKLGPDDHIVKIDEVIDIVTVGSQHCIMYITDSDPIANLAKSWPEFMGFGYVDMVMRIAQGLSASTLSDIEYLTGAHWLKDNEWHFGNVKDWKDSGSPETVWFSRFRDIMGMDLH